MRILAVCALAILCYSNSFPAGLVHDDAQLIQADARVHAVTSNNLDLIFREDYNNAGENLYRPFTTLSFLFNYAILDNGENPAGYHLVNLAIHLVNISLVYFLGLLLFPDWTLAVALAALWGVHPAFTEAVTNIAGRADLLSACGVLAGVLCHAHGRKIAWLCGLALAATIAIFSKESGVVLPAAMLLFDLAAAKRPPWRERWPGYAAVAVPFAAYFALRAQLAATHPVAVIPFVDNPAAYADFLTAKLTAVKYLGVYLRVFLWPLSLSADYSYNQIPLAAFADWRTLVSAAACIALLAVGVLAYRRNRPLFFFALLFFVAIAPVSNFFLAAGTTVGERLLYLPGLGLMGCVVVALSRFVQRRALIATAVALCCLMGIRTFARNFDWYTYQSLNRASINAAPMAFRSYSELAEVEMNGDARSVREASQFAEKALAIVSGLSDSQVPSRIYITAGETFLKRAGLGDPDAATWSQRAYDSLAKGARVMESEAVQTRARNLARGKTVSIQPIPLVYIKLARSALMLGRPREAVAALLAQDSTRTNAAFTPILSEAYVAGGDANAAEVALLEGIVLDPNAGRLAAPLMQLYREKNPQSCAIKGNGIDMGCPLVHDQVCTASRNIAQWYGRAGQPAKAQATAQAAVQQMGCPAALFQ